MSWGGSGGFFGAKPGAPPPPAAPLDLGQLRALVRDAYAAGR